MPYDSTYETFPKGGKNYSNVEHTVVVWGFWEGGSVTAKGNFWNVGTVLM